MKKKILVAGATGRTGQIIISKLHQQGIIPHVLVRNLPAAEKRFGESVLYHLGDVREVQLLINAAAGMDAVISAVGTQTPVGKNCPKRVAYEGVANLVHAALLHKIQQFILLSSIAVTYTGHPLNSFGKILDWKRKGEEVLRESGLNYAIIRPGCMKDTPGGKQQLIFDQGDRILGTISRADVAETCLRALYFPERLNTTFEVIESVQKGQPKWNALFSSLSPD